MSRSPFGRALLGAAAGFEAAYTLLRLEGALADRRAPARPVEPDPGRYGAARRRIMLAGIARSLCSLGLWTFGAADALEPALAGLPRALRLPAYTALVMLTESVRELPADYVEEFVLERIYATSDRSERVWAADKAKAAGVTIVAGTLLTLLADAAIVRAPRRWPWIAIGALPPLLAFANVIVPTFVMPLFNAYVPLEGPLAERIRALAARYGVGGATLLRFDLSRQTKKANAFVTGVLGTERIAVADTLVERFADDETLFVVAHELGHYVRRDPWYGIALGTLIAGTNLIAARAAARRSLGREPAGIGGLARVAFYLSLGQLASGPLASAASRAIERRADRFALAATGDAAAGVRAFRRLRDQNLAEDEGPLWAELLFSSHPSLKSRIAALESAATASR